MTIPLSKNLNMDRKQQDSLHFNDHVTQLLQITVMLEIKNWMNVFQSAWNTSLKSPVEIST